MRFDDSLKTVLSADMGSGSGAQAAWRQLVDLMGRGRIPADDATIARLRLLRQAVPLEVRSASARAIAFATPGAALVGLFAEDTLSVAAPVLRTAVLPAADWLAMLPRMSPEGRSILRHRRDLPGEVVRGLESFGSTDFVLADATPQDQPKLVRPDPSIDLSPPELPTPVPDTTIVPTPLLTPTPAPDTPRSATPFVALGDVARGLPVVAEALRHTAPREDTAAPGGYRIADLVARIDAFKRDHDPDEEVAFEPRTADAFRYETDRDGVIRWVDGVARGPLIGASFAYAAPQGEVNIDAVMGGALRQRARFAGARLDIGGTSDAAGSWRVSGDPIFDHASGRFSGFRGIARRARVDEGAPKPAPNQNADALRQLVHELRTPTNAIAGFAELIEAELLGPVAPGYRDHATTIRRQAASLIAAIEDLDTAARIDGKAIESRPAALPLAPLLAGVARDLMPLAQVRRAHVRIEGIGDATAQIDDRLADRLFSRLLGALLAASAADETIAVSGLGQVGDTLSLAFTRPAAFVDHDEAALLRIDADTADSADGAPLLGIGFALRLVRNLANEVGGGLDFAADRLTLRLPAAVDAGVGQAIN